MPQSRQESTNYKQYNVQKNTFKICDIRARGRSKTPLSRFFILNSIRTHLRYDSNSIRFVSIVFCGSTTLWYNNGYYRELRQLLNDHSSIPLGNPKNQWIYWFFDFFPCIADHYDLRSEKTKRKSVTNIRVGHSPLLLRHNLRSHPLPQTWSLVGGYNTSCGMSSSQGTGEWKLARWSMIVTGGEQATASTAPWVMTFPGMHVVHTAWLKLQFFYAEQQLFWRSVTFPARDAAPKAPAVYPLVPVLPRVVPEQCLDERCAKFPSIFKEKWKSQKQPQ